MRLYKKNYLKSFIGGILNNNSGRKISEKLIIIESDDWGAIRTPNPEAVELSTRFGLDMHKSRYKVDALASEDDLDDLFNVLIQYKDKDGNSPIITANCIMANPDFKKIKEDNFENYHYEVFTKTLKSYPKHQKSFEKWNEAMKNSLFQPQFHGREHLNVSRWLKALRAGDPKVHFSFDLNSTYSGVDDYSFMEAFDWNDESEVEQHVKIINDGLRIFKETFGFESKSFIAPCYTWDTRLDKVLENNKIEVVQNAFHQLQPTGTNEVYTKIKHAFGDVNKHGFVYNNRNVFFEPVTNPNIDWADKVTARIAAAFLMGKPAVISTHRVNYIGFIEPKNKDNGLKHLNRVLGAIQKNWPDAKFISTDKLTQYLN